MLHTVRRLTNLTVLEQALLLQLTARSFGMTVAPTLLTLPRLTAFLSRHRSSARLSRNPLPHTRCTKEHLFTLVDLATTIRHREGRCRPRARLLFWVLRAQQTSAKLCLGVQTALATLSAQAWVELEGVVLGDNRIFTDRNTPILRFPA